jgi:hypothetical protein
MLTLPVGFSAGTVTATAAAGLSASESLTVSTSTTANSQLKLTLRRPNSGSASSGAVSVLITGLVNPGAAGITGDFPELKTASGSQIDLCVAATAAAVGGAVNALAVPPSVTLSAGALTAATLSLNHVTISATGVTAAVALRLSNPLPQLGSVAITFPVQYGGVYTASAAAVALTPTSGVSVIGFLTIT